MSQYKMTDDERWPALLRGQVLAATTNKFTVVVRLVDQKAQVMILLNSVLVPMCLNAIEHKVFSIPAFISIFTAVLSILAAIICIYPKRKYRKKGDSDLNILHFNDIGHMERQDYYDMMLPVMNKPQALAEAVVRDFYDTARYSIIPKFIWLKISYGIFAFGNVVALLLLFYFVATAL